MAMSLPIQFDIQNFGQEKSISVETSTLLTSVDHVWVCHIPEINLSLMGLKFESPEGMKLLWHAERKFSIASTHSKHTRMRV
jgi:hypothetical protein